MNFDQAVLILEYKGIPATRAGQISLIREISYTKLRGKPLYRCSDKQICAVATRLYREAGRKYNSLQHPHFVKRVADDWAKHLGETFNVSWEDVDTEELEGRLSD